MIFLVVHFSPAPRSQPRHTRGWTRGEKSERFCNQQPGPVSELHFCTFVSGAVNLFWPYTVQFCKEEESQIANDCMEGVEGW